MLRLRTKRAALAGLAFAGLALGGCGSEEPGPADGGGDIALTTPSGAVIRFASVAEGAEVLTRADEYSAEVQRREAGIRAQDASVTTFEGYAELYRQDVKAWSEGQKKRLTAAIAATEKKLALIDHHLPDEVLLVLTGTDVEGGLPHTRSNAIIFAGGGIPSGDDLKALFLHELHHVMTRANPDVQDDYFAIISYQPCSFEEPDALRAARLTNPDAPVNKHYVATGEGTGVMPFLFAGKDYDSEAGGRLPNYFGFGLIPVAVEGGVCTATIDDPSGLLPPGEVPAFTQAIGANTGYIINPEETLSDNFVFWAMEQTDKPDPEIIEAVGQFWTELGR